MEMLDGVIFMIFIIAATVLVMERSRLQDLSMVKLQQYTFMISQHIIKLIYILLYCHLVFGIINGTIFI